jgi:hypothetical protein
MNEIGRASRMSSLNTRLRTLRCRVARSERHSREHDRPVETRPKGSSSVGSFR